MHVSFALTGYIQIAEPQGANQALLDAVLLARKLHSAKSRYAFTGRYFV